MKPEEVGNFVQLGETLIPAVNIQVAGVPGWLDHGDGTTHWYGVYFEILFEGGDLWTVDHGGGITTEEDAKNGNWDMNVFVVEYQKFGMTQSFDQDASHLFKDWEVFLDAYKQKAMARV